MNNNGISLTFNLDKPDMNNTQTDNIAKKDKINQKLRLTANKLLIKITAVIFKRLIKFSFIFCYKFIFGRLIPRVSSKSNLERIS